MTFSVIIPAAGSSSRMKNSLEKNAAQTKKEYLPMKSPFFENDFVGTVLSCTAESFLIAAKNNPQFKLKSIIVLVPNVVETAYLDANDAFFAGGNVSLLTEQLTTRVDFIPGGNTRQESVKNALEFLASGLQVPDFVAIHDGARPWIKPELIEECLKTAVQKGNCSPVIDVVDTVKQLDSSSNSITNHLVRNTLGAIQTPQVFEFKKLLDCHRLAEKNNFEATDDSEIWAKFSQEKAFYCKGEKSNKKITYASDIPNVEEKKSQTNSLMRQLPRIGLGYDLHTLVSGRALMLGGIQIESPFGEEGHSDGDVLLHAITDALLGASGLGDIGEFFPPSDEKWKNADSKELLKICWQKIKANGWELGNLDCVINIEKPKILPYREKIIESIAQILECPAEKIFIKAKTAEKLGDIGNSKAVQVWASCIMFQA